MEKQDDELEKLVDESMPFLSEKLGDLSALIEHKCLTVAQCALLMPSILTSKRASDASEMAAHYVQLALLDIANDELCPKHPETLLPYSQYKRMAEVGMFGIDGADMPIPNAGWLIPLSEAERWYRNKGFSGNLEDLKADLAKMAAADASAGVVLSSKRVDSLQIELIDILENMSDAGDKITAGTVMPKLKARAGERYTCVTESVQEGILWARDSGSLEKLATKMLQKRIDRWKSKNTR